MDQQPAIALVGGTVINGTGAAPVPNGCVVVRGREIDRVGRADEVPVPPDARVYDVSGTTIMPGLIDGHVHLRSYAGSGRADLYTWSLVTFVEEQALHAAANARRALEAGVTTVRDAAGGRLEVAVKHAVDQQVLDGARVLVAGFVGMTGGHGDLFRPPAVEQRGLGIADGVDACRALVRRHARDGVDWIKICTSGGVLSLGDENEWRNYTLEETCAVVDEAHALGKRVAAHAHSRSGILQALEAGVDSIEHGSCLDDELIERMLRQGTWLCPTLAVSEAIARHGRERGVPEAALEKNAAVHATRIEAARRAAQAGVRLLMGTDTSAPVLPFGAHAWELELMAQRLGLDPMRAILAATRDAADALGIGAHTGTLEPGKWADILVVDGDPLADLAVLQDRVRLLAVFRDGRLLVERGLSRREHPAGSARHSDL